MIFSALLRSISTCKATHKYLRKTLQSMKDIPLHWKGNKRQMCQSMYRSPCKTQCTRYFPCGIPIRHRSCHQMPESSSSEKTVAPWQWEVQVWKPVREMLTTTLERSNLSDCLRKPVHDCKITTRIQRKFFFNVLRPLKYKLMDSQRGKLVPDGKL